MQRRKCKHRMKYRTTKLCLVFGIVLAYISFYYAMKMSRDQLLEQRDMDAFPTYTYDVTLCMNYSVDSEQVFKLLPKEDVDLSLGVLSLYYDYAGTECLSKAYIKKPAEFPYRFVSGGLPDFSREEPQVILGIGRKKDTFLVEGQDYIQICREPYRVTGYISAGETSIYDGLSILFWDTMGDRTKEFIEKKANDDLGLGIFLAMRSNTVNLQEWYTMHRDELEQVTDWVDIQYRNISTEFNSQVPMGNYKSYTYLLYIFSVIVVIMVMEFWIAQRRQEFIIRRIMGYEMHQLIGLIAREIFSVLGIVAFVLAAFQLLLGVINHRTFYPTTFLLQLLAVLCFILVTFVVLMLYPIYKLGKDSAVLYLGKAGRVL